MFASDYSIAEQHFEPFSVLENSFKWGCAMKEKMAGLDKLFYQRLNGRKSCDTLPASRAGTNTWNSCLQNNNMSLSD